ncbi:MAG: hypothetical protein GY854_24860, partial [Deltaproteobacteria bacterium]|nr:hypothetical protein [Deltaproteobacteria bacterium]
QDDYKELPAAVMATEPDALYIVSSQSNAAPLLDLYLNQFTGHRPFLMLCSAMIGKLDPELRARLDVPHEGVVYRLSTYKNYPEFEVHFVGRYPQYSAAYAAPNYDAVRVFALAAEMAGTLDAESLRRALIDVSAGGVLQADLTRAFDVIHSGGNLDFDGVIGPMDFTPSGGLSANSSRLSTWRYDLDGDDENTGAYGIVITEDNLLPN